MQLKTMPVARNFSRGGGGTNFRKQRFFFDLQCYNFKRVKLETQNEKQDF